MELDKFYTELSNDEQSETKGGSVKDWNNAIYELGNVAEAVISGYYNGSYHR